MKRAGYIFCTVNDDGIFKDGELDKLRGGVLQKRKNLSRPKLQNPRYHVQDIVLYLEIGI